MVEENGSDVVEMAVEGEKASSSLVGPDLDLVIVASRNEERLGLVEVDTSNRSIVFLEAINQGSHSVIPKLDGRGVKRYENPWSEWLHVSLISKEVTVCGASYLLGWKAMPLALEDLDSNYKDTLDMTIARIP